MGRTKVYIGTNLIKVGDIFLSTGIPNVPYMLIEIPHGPDKDHITYNLLDMNTGKVRYIGGFSTLSCIAEELRTHYTKLDHGYVTVEA